MRLPVKILCTSTLHRSDLLLQVTAEGGPDAAVEAPYIWVAQDLLATRVAGAAERRQRALLATMSPAMAAELPSPQEAGAIAARAVKQARARFLLCIGVRCHVLQAWASDLFAVDNLTAQMLVQFLQTCLQYQKLTNMGAKAGSLSGSDGRPAWHCC